MSYTLVEKLGKELSVGDIYNNGGTWCVFNQEQASGYIQNRWERSWLEVKGNLTFVVRIPKEINTIKPMTYVEFCKWQYGDYYDESITFNEHLASVLYQGYLIGIKNS